MSAQAASPAQISEAYTRYALDLAELLPDQGQWSEADYLWLSGRSSRLVEFSNGAIEVLPMPTPAHQKIVLCLYRMLFAFIQTHKLGILLVAPLQVYLWPGKWREPDLVFLLAEHHAQESDQGFIGADLVIEVISQDDPERDRVIKRQEYAHAQIPEYWIVDPQAQSVTVLHLVDDQYVDYGIFGIDTTVTSPLLAGLSIPVQTIFDAAR